jgi:hypothetical protein
MLTLAQERRSDAFKAVARGWAQGLRAMARERRASDGADRGRAAAQLVSVREAVAQQRRLGRT